MRRLLGPEDALLSRARHQPPAVVNIPSMGQEQDMALCQSGCSAAEPQHNLSTTVGDATAHPDPTSMSQPPWTLKQRLCSHEVCVPEPHQSRGNDMDELLKDIIFNVDTGRGRGRDFPRVMQQAQNSLQLPGLDPSTCLVSLQDPIQTTRGVWILTHKSLA